MVEMDNELVCFKVPYYIPLGGEIVLADTMVFDVEVVLDAI